MRRCCSPTDYERLSLEWPWTQWLADELEWWHDDYLPARGTVLDVGAGCGETAAFYLLHGAEHVVAVEGDPRALRHLDRNFGDDKRVTIVPAHVDKVKVDVEGAEKDMDLETHFVAMRWELRRDVAGIRQWRLVAQGPKLV